jgi:thioredoxin-like negative regulator of GroEL
VAEARRELGKIAGRRGDIETALERLTQARDAQLRHGQPGEVLATDARTAEVLILAGRGDDALAIVDDALSRVEETDGGQNHVGALRRVRGWALLQSGRTSSDARTEFAEALQHARSRADAYQVGEALAGLIAVARQDGSNATAMHEERQAIHERLGIVATPTIPMTSTQGVAPR